MAAQWVGRNIKPIVVYGNKSSSMESRDRGKISSQIMHLWGQDALGVLLDIDGAFSNAMLKSMVKFNDFHVDPVFMIDHALSY